jgi:hypothetical protein
MYFTVDHAFSNADKHSGEYALNLVSTLPYFFSKNNRGDSAISLLSVFYKHHPEKFINYLETACGVSRNFDESDVPKLWLLDILPYILEEMEHPSQWLNDHAIEIIYKGLEKMYSCGGSSPRLSSTPRYDSTSPRFKSVYSPNATDDNHVRGLKDSNLLNAIVNVLKSLKHAGNIHILEKRDLDAKYHKFEKMIKSLCTSACMDSHANIASLLLGDMEYNHDTSLSNIRRGLSFTKGALSTCIDNDLKTILGISQISYYVDEMFNCYLRNVDVEPIRDWEDIFQLRSDLCTYFRYGVSSMFYLETFSKVGYLWSIWYVLNRCYPNREEFAKECSDVTHHTYKMEFFILAMFICRYK